jgi:hypothetical protein
MFRGLSLLRIALRCIRGVALMNGHAFARELRRMGEKRSSAGELPIWLIERTRTSIMDEGRSPRCLIAGSSGGHHACSPGKSRLRVSKNPLASPSPSNLEDPVRHGHCRTNQSRKPALQGFKSAYGNTRGLKKIARPVVFVCSTRPSLLPSSDGGRSGEPTLRDHTPLPSSLHWKGSSGTT